MSDMVLIGQWIAEALEGVRELPVEMQGFKTMEIEHHLEAAQRMFESLSEHGR